jgi:hypothetical protein
MSLCVVTCECKKNIIYYYYEYYCKIFALNGKIGVWMQESWEGNYGVFSNNSSIMHTL